MWLVKIISLLATIIGLVGSICILDNKIGWNVDCGVKDSYLFRFKDYGGIKANFDFGLEFGNEKGFPFSISNAGGQHRRNDNRAGDSMSSRSPSEQERRIVYRRRARPGPAFRLRPPPPPPAIRRSRPRPRRRQGLYQRVLAANPFRRLPKPGPKNGRFRSGPRPRAPPHPLPPPGGPVDHSRGWTPPPSPPKGTPTLDPFMADMLKVARDTPANSDLVPSFAAKTFVVREAPEDLYPPGYEVGGAASAPSGATAEVPRTGFFCEEQPFLPGMYADPQLGCKVFHLCLPAALGSTLRSFLCPNMTLFDQSVLQCNFWYHVDCRQADRHYDANRAMAMGYRRINAARLPLQGIQDLGSLSLLSHHMKGAQSREGKALGSPRGPPGNETSGEDQERR